MTPNTYTPLVVVRVFPILSRCALPPRCPVCGFFVLCQVCQAVELETRQGLHQHHAQGNHKPEY